MKVLQERLYQDIEKQTTIFKNVLETASKELKVCITIPAKNEENYLLKTLKAIINQKDNKGESIDKNLYEITVLCHNCNDKTYESALEFKIKYANYNLNVLKLDSKTLNNVGTARRILLDVSAHRLVGGDGWVITTDADTIPEPNWLYNTLTQSRNVDMVCGKILVNTAELDKSVIELLKAKQKYNLLITELESFIIPCKNDPWPKHSNNSGPSLALRKSVYLSVNGIPPVGFLEDIALYKLVKSFGYIIKHDNEVVVETSGRLLSKTEMGLGSELNNWSKHNILYNVEDVEALKRKFYIFKKTVELFSEYNKDLLHQISEISFLKLNSIEKMFKNASIFEQMILKLDIELASNKKWREMFPVENIFIVNKSLDNYIETVRASLSAKAPVHRMDE